MVIFSNCKTCSRSRIGVVPLPFGLFGQLCLFGCLPFSRLSNHSREGELLVSHNAPGEEKNNDHNNNGENHFSETISEERHRVLFEKAGTYLNLTNQSFSFSYRRVRYSLKFDEILYLEKRGRQAIIHTKKMKYQSNMNLNEIWEKLDERMFAAVHGSFIVNLKHVHSVSSGMVMLTDGTELGVTRGYRKELTEKHIAFVQGGM